MGNCQILRVMFVFKIYFITYLNILGESENFGGNFHLLSSSEINTASIASLECYSMQVLQVNASVNIV